MKKIFNLFIYILVIVFSVNAGICASSVEETKKDIIALYNSNQLEKAYEMISKMTEDERDYEIWYLLGNLSQDFNNDTNASFYLQKSIIQNPEFDKAHYNLANIYLKDKRYNMAIKEYKLAIKYKKDFPYYYYNLGCAYLGLKEYKEAKNAFKKAINLKNDVADFYYNLAYAYKNLGNDKEYKNAMESYDKLKED